MTARGRKVPTHPDQQYGFMNGSAHPHLMVPPSGYASHPSPYSYPTGNGYAMPNQHQFNQQMAQIQYQQHQQQQQAQAAAAAAAAAAYSYQQYQQTYPAYHPPQPQQSSIQHQQQSASSSSSSSLPIPSSSSSNHTQSAPTRTLNTAEDFQADLKRQADERKAQEDLAEENAKKTGGKRLHRCMHPGCGKLFSRREHLKRHGRSLHSEIRREFNYELDLGDGKMAYQAREEGFLSLHVFMYLISYDILTC